MQIIPAFVTQNKCYQAGAPLTPRGIMLHSVGTPQPSARALVRYMDQYQPGGQSVCVHAVVQADGTVYQLLPWEMRGWHCGGSANSTHIGVEMTEPSAGMTLDETQSLMDEIISMNTGDDRPAIILIEHEMNVIHRVCQRVVVLNFGSKLCEGTYDEVTKDPTVAEAYLGREVTEDE